MHNLPASLMRMGGSLPKAKYVDLTMSNEDKAKQQAAEIKKRFGFTHGKGKIKKKKKGK